MTAICLAMLFMLTASSSPFPQQAQVQQSVQEEDPDLATGRKELAEKNYQAAISSLARYVLRNPSGSYGHYLLGQSYEGAKYYGPAIAEFEAILKFDPNDTMAHYQIGKCSVAINDYGAAVAQYRWLKDQDAAAAETLLDLLPQTVITQHKLPPSVLAKLLAYKTISKEEVFPMDKNLRPTFTHREKASFTELARANKTQGTISLNMIFGSNGEISDIIVVQSLPDGLTLSAVKAALATRFTPALKDGKPVSVRGNIQYSFTLY